MNEERIQVAVDFIIKATNNGVTVFPFAERNHVSLMCGDEIPRDLRDAADRLNDEIRQVLQGAIAVPISGPFGLPELAILATKTVYGFFSLQVVDSEKEAIDFIHRIDPCVMPRDCWLPFNCLDGRRGWCVPHGEGAIMRWRSGLFICPCCRRLHCRRHGEPVDENEHDRASAFDLSKDALAIFAQPTGSLDYSPFHLRRPRSR